MPTLEKEELQKHVKHTGGIRELPPPPQAVMSTSIKTNKVHAIIFKTSSIIHKAQVDDI